MNVRSAKAADLDKGLFGLVKETHARSRYACYPADEKLAREFLLRTIFFNQRKAADDATHIFVAEHDGALVGYIVPHAERLYHLCRPLMVSDLYFYVRPGSHFAAAHALWDALETWADVPEVVSIQPGITNAVLPDWEIAAKFYEARGYTRIGGIFEKSREPQAARSVA